MHDNVPGGLAKNDVIRTLILDDLNADVAIECANGRLHVLKGQVLLGYQQIASRILEIPVSVFDLPKR